MKKRYILTVGVMTAAFLTIGGLGADAATTHHRASPHVSSGSLSHINHDNYVEALGVMDKFLSDWQNNNAKAGIALLTPLAKKGKTAAELSAYFGTKTAPYNAGYEVVGFKAINENEFEFHVWMYGIVPGAYGPGNTWSRPHPMTVSVIRDKKQNWYVNSLPRY